MGSPVLLVQWLNSTTKLREVSIVGKEFSSHSALECQDLDEKTNREGLANVIRSWRSKQSQFLYIGAHGIFDKGKLIGVGPDENNYIPIQELANLLCDARGTPAVEVWFGYCKSSEVIPAFNEVLKNLTQPTITEMLSFSRVISNATCRDTLRALTGGILGLADISITSSGLSVVTKVIVGQDIDKTILELRAQGGEFEALESYRVLDGRTLSRHIPKLTPP